MAFMASTAWQNISLARTSLVNEHASLSRLAAIPIYSSSEKKQMQSELRQYLTAVLNEEWKLRYNESASAKASRALESLSIGIWNISGECQKRITALSGCTSDLAVSNYLKALDDLQIARDQRVSLAFQGTLRLRWMLAIALALATALAIAAIHRTSARTSAICLGIYGLSIWITFAMVALHIQPYRGPDALLPIVLEELLSKI